MIHIYKKNNNNNVIKTTRKYSAYMEISEYILMESH